MDFVTAIEADHLLPIAFKNRGALDAWVNCNELSTNKLGRRDDVAAVVLIDGLVKPWPLKKTDVGQGLHYRQVWARVDYDHYRNAMKFVIKESEGSHKTVHLYDADHAVSKTRLASLWREAWVNMVFVEKGVNRAIGAMMEKDPLDVPSEADCIEINAESVIKTFFNRGDERMERNRLREYLGYARTRFVQFKNESEAMFQIGTRARLENFLMSENAWGFFDHLAATLQLDPLERPRTPGLVF